ncbi:MAG: biotin/lipoyl-binding protein [Candidatus Rokubacteria bacterium]|nr:biotin/lipoyl-binding protein [Candidatus Rokubacteria bacterium]
MASRGEVGRDLVRLFGVEALVLAWVTILAVTVIHEFAHCLTCKRFGGHVHEMGFLLIYFQPAFYSNVSDAWLFPEKSRRLWVTFAGPYFELLLWALATLTWRVTEPGSWLSSVALVVMATSGIKLFFNLNPLIKLDGYYLLSDFLGIPNLRARAFGYLRALTGRLWGSARQDAQDATPRERRIYLAYGLLAGTYSVWLLGYVAFAFGSFLLNRYQGVGFFLFTGLLALMFRNPLKKALGKVPGVVRRSRGRLASKVRPVALLVCLAAGLAAIFLVRMELRIGGELTVLPIHNADIRAEVEGLIEEIYADEGALVRRGDPIARLADREYRAELRKLEAEIDEKRAKLKMLSAGPRPEEIALQRKAVETAATKGKHARRRYEEAAQVRASRLSRAKADLAKADERLRYARNDLDRSSKLFAEDLIARKQLEEAQERVVVREKEVETAQAEVGVILSDDLAEVRKELAVAQKEAEEADAKLKLLLAGSRSEEIEVARAEVAPGSAPALPLGAARARARGEPHQRHRHDSQAQGEDRTTREEGGPDRRGPRAEDDKGGDRGLGEGHRRREGWTAGGPEGPRLPGEELRRHRHGDCARREAGDRSLARESLPCNHRDRQCHRPAQTRDDG